MHVRENPLLAVLANLLPLDRVHEAVLIQQVRHRLGRVGEHVQVDIGALPDVAGEHAADEPRAKRRQPPHHRQRGQPHGEQVVGAGCAFEQPGQHLDLVADFDVAGQVGRLDPALADSPGRFHLGRVVLRLLPGVHQPGGLPGDLPPQFRTIHQACAVSPSDRRAGISVKIRVGVHADVPIILRTTGRPLAKSGRDLRGRLATNESASAAERE